MINKVKNIKEKLPTRTVAEVVLLIRKAKPHHHSHSFSDLTVTIQEIQYSYLFGKFHPFPLEIVRKVLGKQHGRTNSRHEMDWGFKEFKII